MPAVGDASGAVACVSHSDESADVLMHLTLKMGCVEFVTSAVEPLLQQARALLSAADAVYISHCSCPVPAPPPARHLHRWLRLHQRRRRLEGQGEERVALTLAVVAGIGSTVDGVDLRQKLSVQLATPQFRLGAPIDEVTRSGEELAAPEEQADTGGGGSTGLMVFAVCVVAAIVVFVGARRMGMMRSGGDRDEYDRGYGRRSGRSMSPGPRQRKRMGYSNTMGVVGNPAHQQDVI